MAKLRPLADKILIKRLEAESKTKSGIATKPNASPRFDAVCPIQKERKLRSAVSDIAPFM